MTPILLLAAAMAQAAAPSAPAPAERARWGVDWGDQYCALVRTREGGGLAFAIRILPGSDWAMVVLPEDEQAGLQGGQASVVEFPPTAARFESTPQIRNQLVLLGGEDANLLANVAQAGEIRVLQDGEVRQAVAIPAAGRAVDALRECLASGAARWGIDVQRLASLRQRPRHDRPWIMVDDYPRSAMARNISGTAVVRISIDAEGRINGCTVVATSGDSDLDRASCEHTDRGHYYPALDANGVPTAVEIATPIRWVVSR